MLKNFLNKVEEGDWVHIFPEGKIEQHAGTFLDSLMHFGGPFSLTVRASCAVLGGRSGPRAAEIGRLKWGTAKLIARAEVRPIVVPFYHTNMQKIMPQNERNKLISMVPRTGVHVNVRVGKPIVFDDIFEQFANDHVVGSDAPWETQEQEKRLYSAITKRIEDSLLELADGMYEHP
jgi:1-acyl-sn-glycerol-3-phosphate acyltransferase